MSTARLFAPPRSYEEIERQRDELQVRNAEMRLVMEKIKAWLEGEPIYRMGETCIAPHGWGEIRKMVDEVLK